MWFALFLMLGVALGDQLEDGGESDGDSSRKILGSSVVTSVSVVMDTGNGTKAVFADAVGNPQSRPSSASEVASPIELLNPDRYEFYTFDDNGDLVKKLMSLEEIKSIIATGDTDAFDLDTFSSNGFVPEKRVTDIINNVQNVLKEEIETYKSPETDSKPIFDTPDVSDSWSMILPAVFGNSGDDIKPEKPIVHVTADTIMIEPSSSTYTSVNLQSKNKSPTTPVLYSNVFTSGPTTKSTTTEPSVKVDIFSNSQPTTSKLNVAGQLYYPDDQIFLNQPSSTLTSVKIHQSGSESRNPTSSTPHMSLSSTTNKLTTKIPPQNILTILSSSPLPSQSTSTPSVIPTRYSSTLPLSASDVPLIRNPSTTTMQSIVSTSTSMPLLTSNVASVSTIFQNLTSPTTSKPASSTKTSTPSAPVTKLQGLTTQKNTTSSDIEMPLSTSTQSSSTLEFDNRFGETKPGTNPTTLSDVTEHSTPEITTPVESTTMQDLTTSKYEKNSSSQKPLGLDQNLSASEILNQLLFTTNIYEINTELNAANKNNIDSEVSTTYHYNQQETTTKDLLTESTTTERDFISLPATTDFSLMQSIEQLISQAVNVQDVSAHTENANIQQQILDHLSQSNMSELLKESATLASQLTLDYFATDKLERTDEKSDSINEIRTTTGPAILESLTTIQSPSLNISTNELVGNLESTEIPTTEKISIDATTLIGTNDIDVNTATEGAVTLENQKPSTTKYGENDEPSRIINITIISYNPNKTDSGAQSKIPNYKKHDDQDEFSNVNEPIATTTEVEATTLEYTTVGRTESTTILNNEDATTVQSEINNEPAEESLTYSTLNAATTQTISTEKITTAPPSSKPVKPSIIIALNKDDSTITEGTKVISSNTHEDVKANNTYEIANTKSTTITPLTPHKEATWTLVSTLAPHDKPVTENPSGPPKIQYPEVVDPPAPVDLIPKPIQGFGLEDTTAGLDTDIYQFVQLCNELAFGFWKTVTTDLSSSRSIFVSPFAATSMLAMVFLGARGATSGEMNEILKLDDMVTFNPHLIFKEVSESINNENDSGIATSVIGRELFSDRSKGKLLEFYKNRARAFYDGYVEEVNFKEIGDVIRRRTNLLVKKHSHGKITEFLKDGSIMARSPLAGLGVNIFETDCSQTSVEGRDGEIHFVVSPSIRQRRLIPIPAVVYKSGFLAGYEPSLDATAISLGTKDQTISTIFVIPGQQGMPGPADSLSRLEKRLVESSFRKGAWSRLLRSLIPRPGLELQIPRFSHRSIVNATSSLRNMGLHALFDAETADLRGLNGVANELYLSDVLQINSFATCGEKNIGETHHSEIYPATALKSRSARFLSDLISPINFEEEPRDYQRSFDDPLHDPELFSLPLSLRPRQARVPEVPRLRFDRPFLYFIRHNPTGLILHMGRFNPRLLP